MNPTTRRNFEVFTATDFLAAITQHIPEKGAQTVKYYGYYSNKARGQRAQAVGVGRAGLPDTTLASRGLGCPGQPPSSESAIGNPHSTIPKKIPTRTWRELIKRAWDVDPLLCPKCGGQMCLISLIEEDAVIEKILRHLDLWEGLARAMERAPPPVLELGYIREPFYDDLPFGPDAYAE